MSTDSTPRSGRGTSVVVAGSVFTGYLAAVWAARPGAAQMLPWIMGRGLGVAAFVTLAATTALGLWVRHRWRLRVRWPAATTQLWLHRSLATTSVVLVAGHVIALVLDPYAGVGWRGAVIPGASAYRPTAVAYGTVAAYLMILVTASALLAGRIGGRSWFVVHRIASAVFGLVVLHGVLAGSDASRLRLVYVASAATVVVLWVTRGAGRAVRADA